MNFLATDEFFNADSWLRAMMTHEHAWSPPTPPEDPLKVEPSRGFPVDRKSNPV